MKHGIILLNLYESSRCPIITMQRSRCLLQRLVEDPWEFLMTRKADRSSWLGSEFGYFLQIACDYVVDR